MPSLAFDTATAMLSVAVGEAGICAVSVDVHAPRDHMARLAPLVEWALGQAGSLSFADLDGVVVGLGPGSYTGVRIGVAFAKGVARAAGLPLIGVPSCDGVAQRFMASEQAILVLADAARGEVYPMWYRRAGGAIERDDPFRVQAAEDAAADLTLRIAEGGEAPVLAGDGLVRHLDVFRAAAPSARVAARGDWYPSARHLIERAAVLGPVGGGDPDRVLPIYTRGSDAEEAAARAVERGASP